MPDIITDTVLLAGIKWVEFGATSATNPVHATAFSLLLEPLGIGCTYMEFLMDPEGNSQADRAVLKGLTWAFDRVDADARVLFPQPPVQPYFEVTIDASARFTFRRTKAIPTDLLPLVDAFGEGKVLNQLTEIGTRSCAKIIREAWVRSASHLATESDAQAFLDDPVNYTKDIYARLRAVRQK